MLRVDRAKNAERSSSHRLGLRGVSIALAAAVLSTAPRGHASPLRLGLDVEQGVYSGVTGNPYTFDVQLAPGYDLGRLRLSGSVGAGLSNPEWDVGFGFAPSFVVVAVPTSTTGLRVVAEGNYFTRNGWRALGGFVFDLDSVHIGELAGYDSLKQSPIFLTTIGIDLPTIVTFFSKHPF